MNNPLNAGDPCWTITNRYALEVRFFAYFEATGQVLVLDGEEAVLLEKEDIYFQEIEALRALIRELWEEIDRALVQSHKAAQRLRQIKDAPDPLDSLPVMEVGAEPEQEDAQ